jgi:hypothetical protein
MKHGASGGIRWAAMGWLVLTALSSRADIVSTSGSLFNPGDAAFAGATKTLSLTSGSITFNTDSGVISGSLTGMNPSDYFFQGHSQSGQASLGVFVFDSINLPQGVTITVTGSQGLVLASRHDLTLGTTLQLNGASGVNLSVAGGTPGTSSGGAGASGAEGGSPSPAAFNSTTAINRGAGGRGGFGSGSSKPEPGTGRGGGRPASGASNPSGGAGGAYGGVGGKGSSNSTGGSSYGDSLGDLGTADLFGGSGGSGAYRSASASGTALAGGGGGGGAVELIALGTLDLSGSIEAKGGGGGNINRTSTNTGADSAAGGGGSGGGIILAASQINLSGTVDVSGGAGGSHSGNTTTRYYGGGGGGGRIALYYQTLSGTPALGSNIFVSGGTATTGVSNAGTAGSPGTFFNGHAASFPFQPVSTPELSSFCLAMIGALPVLLRRRPH